MGGEERWVGGVERGEGRREGLGGEKEKSEGRRGMGGVGEVGGEERRVEKGVKHRQGEMHYFTVRGLCIFHIIPLHFSPTHIPHPPTHTTHTTHKNTHTHCTHKNTHT